MIYKLQKLNFYKQSRNAQKNTKLRNEGVRHGSHIPFHHQKGNKTQTKMTSACGKDEGSCIAKHTSKCNRKGRRHVDTPRKLWIQDRISHKLIHDVNELILQFCVNSNVRVMCNLKYLSFSQHKKRFRRMSISTMHQLQRFQLFSSVSG